MYYPGAMKGGMACGLLGGLVCFFALAYLLSVDDAGMSIVATMAIYLLSAVMFFAMAGGFSKTSQWTQNILIGYCFLAAGVLVAVAVSGLVPLWFFIIEIILVAIAVLCASVGNTAKYLSSPESA